MEYTNSCMYLGGCQFTYRRTGKFLLGFIYDMQSLHETVSTYIVLRTTGKFVGFDPLVIFGLWSGNFGTCLHWPFNLKDLEDIRSMIDSMILRKSDMPCYIWSMEWKFWDMSSLAI